MSGKRFLLRLGVATLQISELGGRGSEYQSSSSTMSPYDTNIRAGKN